MRVLLIWLAFITPSVASQASWYHEGKWTASGERYNPDGITCATRTYRRGMTLYMRVTNLLNGKSVVCRVNDYGPAAWTHRDIDVSRGTARLLSIITRGVAPVRIERVR